MTHELIYIDNPAAGAPGGRYAVCRVAVEPVLRSWRSSLFSFEWLDADGRLLPVEALSPARREARQAVEARIAARAPLPRPVLGIGLGDHVEIGSGKALFLTLAAQGYGVVPVHVPRANLPDFEEFLADDDPGHSAAESVPGGGPTSF